MTTPFAQRRSPGAKERKPYGSAIVQYEEKGNHLLRLDKPQLPSPAPEPMYLACERPGEKAALTKTALCTRPGSTLRSARPSEAPVLKPTICTLDWPCDKLTERAKARKRVNASYWSRRQS